MWIKILDHTRFFRNTQALGELVRREVIGCVKPGGHLWHLGRKRLLLGREKLAVQGVFPDPVLCAEFSQANQSELAGNAFCAPNFLAVFASAIYGLGVSSEFEPYLRLAPSGTPCFPIGNSSVERSGSSSSFQESFE